MSKFEFSNLCGSVYTRGNLLFSPDGDSLVSPVGNRVTVFNLASSTSTTLPLEHKKDIRCMCLSPDGALLLSVDVAGRCLVTNIATRNVLHHFAFKEVVRDIQFSPDGGFVAAAVGRKLQVWLTPGRRREFSPFVLHRTYAAHHDDVRSVAWSEDGRYIGTASKDMTARVFSLHPEEGFTPITLAGHRDQVLALHFVHAEGRHRIYTIGRDGGLFTWVWEADDTGDAGDEDNDTSGTAAAASGAEGSHRPAPQQRVSSFGAQSGQWKLADRHYFQQNHARVVSSAIARHSKAGGTAGLLLAVGFTNGVFSLNQLVPTFQEIHSLSISQHTITAAALNPTGEWVAFGSAKLGQLLVWEWRSETYVLKQQGHRYDVCALAYSPNGTAVVTGGDDGKVKVWQTTTGFCTVTFTEHTAPVRSAIFAKGGNVVVSASVDGTVRAFDLLRYRNFRTFTSPQPAAFASLAVDAAGEVVAAGTADSFEIYVWAMQTGRLLDVLSGHEGPVSALAFTPGTAVSSRILLASGSWDSSVRLWDVFSGRGGAVETFENSYDVLSLCFRPDGQQLAVCALDGSIKFWSTEGELEQTIEGRYDVRGGRGTRDVRAAEHNAASHHFTTLAYSADGGMVLAGGNSRWVCLYDAASKVLLQRFEISTNTSLDGVVDRLNSKNDGEAGPVDLIDDPDDDSDLENDYDRQRRDKFDAVAVAGGAKDDGRRSTPRRIRVHCVRFCPTGHGWCAATTEGLMLFRSDRGGELMFDPSDLEMELTRQSVLAHAHGRPEGADGSAAVAPNASLALMGSLRLGEPDVVREAFLCVRADDIDMVAASLPSPFIPKLLRFLVDQVSTSRHVEFNMRWVLAVLSQHGPTIRERAHTVEMAPLMRALQRAISSRQSVMSQLADDNCYSLRYLGGAAVAQGSENDNASDMSSDEEQQQQQQEEKEEEEEEGLESEDEEDSGSWIVPERAPKRVKS